MADGVRLMQAATTGNITEGGRKLMARSDLRQGISEFRMRAQQHYNRTDTGSVKMPELDFDMSGFDTTDLYKQHADEKQQQCTQ